MNFKVFLLIFALLIFLSKYPPIFYHISDISVKSKYRYIRDYRYFDPWLLVCCRTGVIDILVVLSNL